MTRGKNPRSGKALPFHWDRLNEEGRRKILVSFRPELLAQLDATATASKRSRSAELTERLEQSFAEDERGEEP